MNLSNDGNSVDLDLKSVYARLMTENDINQADLPTNQLTVDTVSQSEEVVFNQSVYKAYAKSPTLTPPSSQASNSLSPKFDLDNFINSYIQPVDTQEAEQMNQASLNKNYLTTLNEYLSNSGLTLEQQAQVRFYQYHPELTPSATIAAALTEANAAVLQTLNAPQGWQPEVDSSVVDVPASVAYDDAFKSALDNYISASGKPLTDEQKKLLLYMLANPNDTSFPEYKQLIGIKNQIDGNVKPQIMAQFGMPIDQVDLTASWRINGEVSGEFNYQINKALSDLKDANNLTNADLQQIKAALSQDNIAGLPTRLQGVAEKLLAGLPDIVASLRASYGLPATWQPQLTSLPSDFPANEATFVTAKTLDDMIASLRDIYGSAPESPQKILMLNYLKIIADALTQLRNMLYQLQTADSSTAIEMSKANLSMEKEKGSMITQNLEEARKQQEKQKVLSDVMKALGPILIVLSLLIAAFTGGLASFIVAAVMAVITLVDQYTGGFGKMFDEITKAIDNDPNISQENKEAVKIVVKLLMITALVAASALTGAGISSVSSAFTGLEVTLTGLQITMTALMSSKVIVDILKSANVPESQREIIAMVIGLIMMVATMIVGMKALSNASKDLIQSGSKTVEAIKKVLDKIADKVGFLSDILRGVGFKIAENRDKIALTFRIIQQVLTAGSNGVSAYSNITQAQYTLKKADVEATIEQLEAVIKMMRKVIDKLLNGLGSVADGVESVSNQSREFWKSQGAQFSGSYAA